jgi:hypothetical protein
MRIGRAAFAAVSIGLLSIALVGGAMAARGERGAGRSVRIRTDGHLTPGHLESIRVAGFPGKGSTAVSFFPTAICEKRCGAQSRSGGPTDAKGSGTLEVRVPGTFTNEHGHPAYFRDGERIEVEVTWEGTDHSFAVGSAEPEPVIVRVHDGHHG